MLPVSLWMYALKTAMYLLNRVPSKAVQKTPFELWTISRSTVGVARFQRVLAPLDT